MKGNVCMTQEKRLDLLISYLLGEHPEYKTFSIPAGNEAKRKLFRSLANVRPPAPASNEFLKIQDEYLQEEIRKKGITNIENLTPAENNIFLWKGDITTLCTDAIVNAANNRMLGCFIPCHGCIDNAIHTFAGVQLRLDCADIMRKQKAAEPTGSAKITGAYNLPCQYILHTVGPIVEDGLTSFHEAQLASCYNSCLTLSTQHNINSIAFCCISTGEFGFPNHRAAEIAIDTVRKFKSGASNELKVIFNVFKESDYNIYKTLVGTN